nr:autotransporter domain-containing protein [uncultured Polynucleobacter sp.]
MKLSPFQKIDKIPFVVFVFIWAALDAVPANAADATIPVGTIVTVEQYTQADSTLTVNGAISVNPGTGIKSNFNNSIIVNNGSISALSAVAIVITPVSGSIAGNTIVNNSGASITGTNAISIDTNATVSSITNRGAITGSFGGIYVNTGGVLQTLNNAQGGNSSSVSTTALTFNTYSFSSSRMPTNYNIIINSPTYYGQLSAVGGGNIIGSTAFGIHSGSVITTKIYAGVLQGFSSSYVGATRSGTYGNFGWTLALQSGSSTIWDLIFTGASTADTQSSLMNTASVLQNIYTLQNSVLANSFSYDCPLFDKNNVCISAGGRNTAVTAANGLNNTSGLLIAAYRPHMNYRVGAYVDQNLSVNNAGSTVNLGNNTPLIGLFGAWNERLDGTGAEVKVSAAYGQKNTTVTRSVVGTSEAGTGSSQLNSQGAQAVAKYGFGVAQNVIVSPYAGIRYTQNNMGGYTEATSASVTAPLTYSALNTNATTALAGVGASYRFIPQATAFVSAGVETDTNTANGSYSATGVTGLTPVNFNANPVKTRPTAMVGVTYDVEKNQRIGITGIYRQEPYQAVSTTTVMATYTVGL